MTVVLTNTITQLLYIYGKKLDPALNIMSIKELRARTNLSVLNS